MARCSRSSSAPAAVEQLLDAVDSGEPAQRSARAAPGLQSPSYGFGFGVVRDALGLQVGHSGGFSGISSCLYIHLDTGWTIVVLSNLDDGMPPVAQKLREVAGRLR